MKRSVTCLATLMLLAGVSQVRGAIIVPGFNVDVYANVTDPRAISFDPVGNLYVGRDAFGSGGSFGEPVRIHRVSPGGTTVVEFGDTAITDPDVVLFDALGLISGTANSVLVGGVRVGGGHQISAILPNEDIITIPGLSGTSQDVNGMAFDSANRFVFTDDHHVFVENNGSPLELVSFPDIRVGAVAVDGSDNIYVSIGDQTIKKYDPNGILIDSTFVSTDSFATLAFGNGGSFGTDLYVIDEGSGNLLSVDSDGNPSIIGNGFSTNHHTWITFGLDGALYAADFEGDRILRITPVPEPTSFALAIFGLLGIAAVFLHRCIFCCHARLGP